VSQTAASNTLGHPHPFSYTGLQCQSKDEHNIELFQRQRVVIVSCQNHFKITTVQQGIGRAATIAALSPKFM
jgi:hypothetical protein